MYLFAVWAYCAGELGINGEKINCETKVLGPQSKSIDATKQSP